jgi:GTP-binding protein HflX
MPLENEALKRALLVAVYRGSGEALRVCEEHLQELAHLVRTYGALPVHSLACPVRKIDASTYVGSGKLEELIDLAAEYAVDFIVFDEEISPSQQRNLEKAFGISVMDRTEVILEVFGQRAQTREARLQIELARTKYQYPRLKRLWTHLSRQKGTGGGGGYLKGEGEKQIELDRRMVQDKIDKLRGEIDSIETHRKTQRSLRARSEIPVFAIIGYTNAGKSTLLNALTDADVLAEDKLFATLDTTTRKFSLSNKQEILFIDTVGFIRKLPHLLVAAFKGTLEEAMQADILLHLIDASHPMAEEQADAVLEVLKELNAEKKPIITIFNKVDRDIDNARMMRLRMNYPNNIQISALEKTGFNELEEVIIRELSKQRRLLQLRVPQSRYDVVSEVMRLGHILNQDFDENDILLKVELPFAVANKLKQYIVPEEES